MLKHNEAANPLPPFESRGRAESSRRHTARRRCASFGQPARRVATCWLLSVAAWLGLHGPLAADVAAEGTTAPVNFNHDVRPILNRYCTSCHGGVKQAGDVSFIYRERVLDAGIIEPGDPANSELIKRVRSTDPEKRMPPVAKHADPLSPAEISVLERWIQQGAPWGNHWSLEPPVAAADPALKQPQWPRVPLDRWVLARLEQEGWTPAPEAAPREWLRRVYLDLIGLPPTPAEFETFVTDCAQRPNEREAIYADVVHRLLESPHFGERWAAMWLDLARYADSMGFEKDPHRDMWPYRDWLIRAFNADMPFDEFTTKQLAGDLLPNADADSLVATSFHRNTQTNTEGGTDDEEFRVAAVIDRVNTTWTVWQATTFRCVQCHSHPYDPFRHEEYYRFMAFFNNAEDHDLDDDYPTVTWPADAAQVDRCLTLDRQIAQLKERINDRGKTQALQTNDWSTPATLKLEASHGSVTETPAHDFVAGLGTYPPGTEFKVVAAAAPLTAIRLQLIPENDDPAKWPETGVVVSKIEAAWQLANGERQPIPLQAAYADYLAGPFDPSDALVDGAPGFGGYPKLVGPRWAVFTCAAPMTPPDQASLVITLRQEAQTCGARPVNLRRFALQVSGDGRWIDLDQSPAQVADRQSLDALSKERQSVQGAHLPILRERVADATRPTRVFVRGNWLDHGQQVTAGTPGVMPALTVAHPTRLDLSAWILARSNPLTPRVWVNRIWAELFGIGIVETLEDFGSTGTPPSHPELLDHLAVRMRDDNAWHLKPFLRELVMSATYRQAQRVRPEVWEKDPQNRLLAHGPHTRLTAEMIRDQALVAAGLFTPKIGGPSVMPPQPDGVWRNVYNSNAWTTAEGPDRYRRAIYTYCRRTSPYPSSIIFDAPSREFCNPRRVPTNTPLQALVTLNDPVYIECAQSLARQAQQTNGDDVPASLSWMYRGLTQQMPSEKTQAELRNLYDAAQHEYSQPSEAAAAPAQLSPAAHQFALTIVANSLLNIDRAVTK